MNRSSSFYSQAYYQKARKAASKKKTIYRERNKELYDQEHELEILRYYRNKSGRCEMIKYYELIAELFFVMRQKEIKGSDEYNQTVKDYVAKVNERIKYFHDFLECDDYETRQERKQRIKLQTMNQQTGVTVVTRNLEQTANKIIIRKPNQDKTQHPRRLDTCNQCPIFIEQYEVNFQKTTTLMAKQSSYWEKLNGNQKLAKFRRYIQQNLKILKYQLENKCEFAPKDGRRLNRKLFGRP